MHCGIKLYYFSLFKKIVFQSVKSIKKKEKLDKIIQNFGCWYIKIEKRINVHFLSISIFFQNCSQFITNHLRSVSNSWFYLQIGFVTLTKITSVRLWRKYVTVLVTLLLSTTAANLSWQVSQNLFINKIMNLRQFHVRWEIWKVVFGIPHSTVFKDCH